MNLSVFRYKGYIIDNNVLIRRVQNMVGYNVSMEAVCPSTSHTQCKVQGSWMVVTMTVELVS